MRPLDDKEVDDLLVRNADSFERAVARCVVAGPSGAARLAAALDVLTGWRRVVVAAALGDVSGPGSAALRRAISARGRGTADLRCASLLALAKRDRKAATPDLVDGLRDPAVTGYALLSLARFGEGSAWDAVLAAVERRLMSPSRATQMPWTDATYGLAYLVRCAEDLPRRDEVTALIDRRASRLLDQERTELRAWGLIGEAGAHRVDWPGAKAAVELMLDADPLFNRSSAPG